ncbi:MAG: hypothetical protein ACE5FF_08140, partial [Saprospiraceae bacterium]
SARCGTLRLRVQLRGLAANECFTRPRETAVCILLVARGLGILLLAAALWFMFTDVSEKNPMDIEVKSEQLPGREKQGDERLEMSVEAVKEATILSFRKETGHSQGEMQVSGKNPEGVQNEKPATSEKSKTVPLLLTCQKRLQTTLGKLEKPDTSPFTNDRSSGGVSIEFGGYGRLFPDELESGCSPRIPSRGTVWFECGVELHKDELPGRPGRVSSVPDEPTVFGDLYLVKGSVHCLASGRSSSLLPQNPMRMRSGS